MERPLKKFDIDISITGTEFTEHVEDIPSVFSKGISLYCKSLGTQFSEEILRRYVDRGIDDENYDDAISSLSVDIVENIQTKVSNKLVNPTKLGVNYDNVRKLISAAWNNIKDIPAYQKQLESFKDQAEDEKDNK